MQTKTRDLIGEEYLLIGDGEFELQEGSVEVVGGLERRKGVGLRSTYSAAFLRTDHPWSLVSSFAETSLSSQTTMATMLPASLRSIQAHLYSQLASPPESRENFERPFGLILGSRRAGELESATS